MAMAAEIQRRIQEFELRGFKMRSLGIMPKN
jgi:hypothetical protein